jgi:photosystem II stability/assembly factor-like uncharacterized protein
MRKLVVLVLVALGMPLLVSAAAFASTPTLGSLAAPLAGAGPGVFAASWSAPADVTNPTVGAVDPVTAFNDIDTAVTITGTGFATDASGTIPPTATLGSTPLTNVTFVDSTTLTATVPWGMSPGGYAVTVTNPDGGTGSLSGAFTVGAGIGQWNPGDLFGGEMQQLFMKPGDPTTLYATAYGVIGLFRSTDAGEHWAFVSDKAWANNTDVAVDPAPGHEDWLYVFTPSGLMRSQNEGDTWTTLMPSKWPEPDGRDLGAYPQVHVSPYQDATHPQALFVSSCEAYVSGATGPKGLIKSTDGGAHWTIVPSLKGVPVQDIAFDPNDHAHMVLVTSDVKIYTSSDWGDSWTQATTSGLTTTTLGLGGAITYNPGGSEVWINAPAQPVGGGIFKSASSDLASWQDVSPMPGYGSWVVSFTGPGSVYISRFRSTTGGAGWDVFGPTPWYGYGGFVSDPADPLTAYITNDAAGVQKTADLLDPTPTWQDKVQGLTALSCSSLAVSQADPLRVYAAFYGPLGVYRSLDGTSTWTFLPISGASQVRRVLVDPFDSRVYAGADTGFYTSTDGGDTWTGTGWNLTPSTDGGLIDMAADPFEAGHLLACFGGYDVPRLLYSSTNFGASWQAVGVNLGSGEQVPHCIAFDPATQGTIYVAAHGVYKSTNGGATWQRIDDRKQPGMAATGDISIATHPQHVVAVEASGHLYRSVDHGATWQEAMGMGDAYGSAADMFVDGDSTRLYQAAQNGLFFSSDAGDSWQRAAGVIGQVQTTALGSANMDGHTIIYAATNGGHASMSGSAVAGTRRAALAVTTRLVDAGVYRNVVVVPKLSLKLSGLRGGTVLRLRKYVTAKGVVTPSVLAGGKVKFQVQRWVHRWTTVKTILRPIGPSGAYGWSYRPAKRGSYRLRATVVKTATNTAVGTTWRGFKVK